MDQLELAYAHRARSAIDMMTGSAKPNTAKAAAFVTIARRLLGAGRNEIGLAMLRSSEDALIQKAAAEVLDIDELWRGSEAQALAAAYIESVAEFSIFDQLKKYARVIPPNMRHCMIASDAVGNMAAEGAPKPVINLGLNVGDVDNLKAVAIVAMTSELARATGDEGQRLFERELREAVTRAMNRSILQVFVNSNTPTASAGADPLASLRAGLLAAGPSMGYVVGVDQGAAAWLATHEANRGMGVRGGEFAPGIHVVAVDDLSGIVVIPASRVALFDGGVRVASTDSATLDMRDSPESPAHQVSLFQTNTTAILVERQWHLAGDAEAVTVAGS